MSRQTFIQGTLILLSASIINRILGFIPRVALPRIIGAEGVGLYQMSYPFLLLLLTLITGGIPLAICKMVAEADAQGDNKKIKSIIRIALIVSVGLSILFFLVSVLMASWITEHLLTDSRAFYTFLCSSPIILIVGISSVYRGYFQGKHNMIPTAVSQLIETLIRIVAVLWLAYILLPYGIEFAAAGAMIGVVIGEIGGLFVLLYHFRKNKSLESAIFTPQIENARKKGIFTSLMRIAIPVTGNKMVGASSYFLESIVIVQSLAIAGVTTALATAQYGALQGMIIPILLLPGALTYSLSISLIPSLSEAAARNDMVTIHQRIHQAIKLTLVTGAPFAVIMYVFAVPICILFYNNGSLGSMLQMMAPIALFLYVQGPLQAALQALDRSGTALLNTFAATILKISLIYILASNPELGIMGALLAININIAAVTLLHWRSVVKHIRFKMSWMDLFKIIVSSALMFIVCLIIFHKPWISSYWIRFFAGILVGTLVYFCSALGIGLIAKNDFLRISKLVKRRTKKIQ